MTARLGSKYRYFGKLVLVPFRYFSIDIYRNIDIFDNTMSYKQYCLYTVIVCSLCACISVLFIINIPRLQFTPAFEDEMPRCILGNGIPCSVLGCMHQISANN